MRIFDGIKLKNIDEFAKWLDKCCYHDNAPWMNWFDKNYCRNCEGISIDGSSCGDYAYCEINKKCKFFPNLDKAPDCEQIVRMWLESEE